ncbi:protein kinase [Kitasatospora sp. NPDC056181]|uniref:serine/threonine-protein kinase n=1 Tax=Kitasatospora sp. NPDC056181 TaxID=3345737 RepID=UPI0035DBA52E
MAGYRTGEPIGAGAWGTVHAAHGTGELPDAAVKFLSPARLSPGQRRTMAQVARSEMRFSRLADHPHLIRTLAVVTVDDPTHPGLDGAVALVMERAARSLQDVLAAARPHAPVPGAERILAEVGAGLTHMHGAGWVHGDLKPGNILLMADGTAKLADFGLTAELEGTHAYAPPLGSPDHVPPEWWSERTGARGVALRPSADIWAFGVLAHQLLTGGLHPFLGATARARSLAAQAYARGAAPLRLDDALPACWREVVTACLAVDREARGRVDLTALLTAAAAGGRQGTAAGRERGGRRRTRPGRAGAGSAGAGSPVPRPGRATAVGAGSAGAFTGAGTGAGRLVGLAGVVAAAAVVVVLTGAPEPVGSPEHVATAGPAPGASPPSSPAGLLPPGAKVPAVASSGAKVPVAVPSGALPPGADVPAELRGPIDDAARRCPEPEITPALLAAMLKAESGFDPKAAHPESGEYGIAMWTPAVFNAWAQDADHDGVKDYFDPVDAIASMGNYVCWLDQQFKHRGMTGSLPALVTAGYRTSDKTVADAGGVPDRVSAHVAKVLGYLAEYGG